MSASKVANETISSAERCLLAAMASHIMVLMAWNPRRLPIRRPIDFIL